MQIECANATEENGQGMKVDLKLQVAAQLINGMGHKWQHINIYRYRLQQNDNYIINK